ncbi:hypothetical protein Metli_2263 [Methanofollis liminatans DSM 4140]|uniref:DUF4956 domain-containing protein n=1 Tax=Methanofollis liminatans DSM 4140 TaxID=28892 RepID=J1L4Z4_9EURY|nr:DUF4956 domain-containing protein [Methanofollis liminatans]EJG08202.1 hypothetical protein Metli_2263 [Methanofollis liminatans DSM 4140]
MLSDTELLFVAGSLVNLLFASIIVRYIYYLRNGEHTYIFTFLAFNTVVYFIMGLFTSVEISIGAGFGLFALFSVLRYRTETVPIREMTYLFVMVALPVLNSILLRTGAYAQLLLSDAVIILILWALEKGFGFRPELRRKQVVYEKIDLVRADRREEMIADLRERTGLDVVRCEVERIDFLRDTAEISVYYAGGPVEKK